MTIRLCLMGFVTLMAVSNYAQADKTDTAPIDACAYDNAAMLSLDLRAFDQDLSNGGGGWRKIGNISGCERAAADLINEYRKANPTAKGLLTWHEGQMRASVGQYAQAIELFEQSRKKSEEDRAGWNFYVDASIAFLKRDKAALLVSHEQLSKVPAQEGTKLKNGYFEIARNGAPSYWMRWPPNIDVVNGFLNCFEKSYDEAYKSTCRPPKADQP